MKSGLLVIAIVQIAIGVVSLAYQGITYTTREKVLEVGPIKATKEKEQTIPLPPILGGLALAGGVVLGIPGVILAVPVALLVKSTLATVFGTIAIVAAMSNVVGGFLITDRMLKMFKASGKPKP